MNATLRNIDTVARELAAGNLHTDREPKVKPSKKINGLKVAQSNHPPTVFLFDNLLYNGLTVLAGRPKQGKSWMALQLAIDAALGRPGLGKFPACHGPQGVLYYGLEEKDNRTKNRLAKLIDPNEPLQQNIQFIYELMPLMGGGLEVIEADLQEQHYGFVVIDTLYAALGGASRKRNADIVAEDYNVVKGLQDLAQKYQTAILLIHHTRKAGSDNSIDKVQGTTGITAGCDAVWVIERGPKCTTLDISPRDMEAAEYAVHMNTDEQAFGWSVVGDADDARTSEARWEILDLLQETTEPMQPNDIAKALRKNRVTVRRLLSELRKSGQVSKALDGYRISR